MSHREIDTLRARLKTVAAAAQLLSRQAEDLFLSAYERSSTSHLDASVSGGLPSGVDSVGDRRARLIWRRLDTCTRQVETELVAFAQAVGNLLSSGPGVTPSRGSLIHPSEFARLKRAQRQRRQRGEYVPWRSESQPRHPSERDC